MRSPLLALALLGALAGAASADASLPGPAAVAAPPPSPEATARARKLFQRGVEAYDRGAFERAAQLFDEAYHVVPLPAVLFNVGQAQARAGQNEAAVATLRRYLALAPETRQRPAVERQIAELQQK